jgi:hypothetical protein
VTRHEQHLVHAIGRYRMAQFAWWFGVSEHLEDE